METWLEWARGPAFRVSIVIMFLGLARVFALNTISIAILVRRAKKNQRKVSYGSIAVATLKWMFPFKKTFERRALFSITSLVFHVAIIVTPVFLGAHILLWERGLGFVWPAVSNAVADVLTVIGIVAGLAIFIQRLGARSSRAISRLQDYLWPLLITTVFASGFLAMHPTLNPLSYQAAMLVHVISGDLILVLIPFSKLSHIALFPATQIVSDLGWYLRPGADRNVALTLGKENEPI
ncbi:MAG: hypothetical protein JRJ87_20085 [Deltaproteobacteria bacterium]|nr:hypothetical protein [Deltaproteobacteria bacterium]